MIRRFPLPDDQCDHTDNRCVSIAEPDKQNRVRCRCCHCFTYRRRQRLHLWCENLLEGRPLEERPLTGAPA